MNPILKVLLWLAGGTCALATAAFLLGSAMSLARSDTPQGKAQAAERAEVEDCVAANGAASERCRKMEALYFIHWGVHSHEM